MVMQILLFLAIGSVVGVVNLLLSQPLERSMIREFASFATVVMGGIAAFTAVVVLVSMFFQ